jgi:hypothetical protein
MSSDDKTTPRFVPLNDTNYSQWAIRMEAELIRKDLWKLVTCTTDVEGKTDAEIETVWNDWRKKRSVQKMSEAYAEIVLRVEDSQLAHTRSRDPEAIWDTLAQVHQARGLAMRLALRRKFLTSVKGTEETMSAWIGRVKGLSYRLEDIGVDISEEDTILALTMGLNPSYDPFIISLDSTPADQLDINVVISRMLNEEVRRENAGIQGVAVQSGKPEIKVKKEDRDNVALAATQGDGPAICWRCGKPGHVRAFCTAAPIRGKGADHANVAFSTIGIDSDDEYLTQVSGSEI